MKVVIGVIFSILTAAAIVAGIILWINQRNVHQELVQEYTNVNEEIFNLRDELENWRHMGIDLEDLKQKLDSLERVLIAAESEVGTLILSVDSVQRTPELVISPAQASDNWSIYTYQLTFEARTSDLGSVILRLAENLPLIRFDRIGYQLEARKHKTTIIGSVKFPRREDTDSSTDED